MLLLNCALTDRLLDAFTKRENSDWKFYVNKCRNQVVLQARVAVIIVQGGEPSLLSRLLVFLPLQQQQQQDVALSLLCILSATAAASLLSFYGRGSGYCSPAGLIMNIVMPWGPTDCDFGVRGGVGGEEKFIGLCCIWKVPPPPPLPLFFFLSPTRSFMAVHAKCVEIHQLCTTTWLEGWWGWGAGNS